MYHNKGIIRSQQWGRVLSSGNRHPVHYNQLGWVLGKNIFNAWPPENENQLKMCHGTYIDMQHSWALSPCKPLYFIWSSPKFRCIDPELGPDFAQMTIYFYLFVYFRKGKGGRKRGKETSVCGCLSCTPYQGPGLQHRHVP